MLSYHWVGLGGVIGSAARFWILGFVTQRSGQAFPYGNLTVNIWLGYFSVSVVNKR